MNMVHKKEPILLFIGDLCILLVSLWLTLLVRFGDVPSVGLFREHLAPFSVLFVAFILVNFIAGLYEKHTLLVKTRLPTILINVQLVNAALGIAFFYFIPYLSIAPKTILFIYLIVSLLLMSLWRMIIVPRFSLKKTQRALLIIGEGRESEQLIDEINNNSRYNISFVESIVPTDDLQELLGRIHTAVHTKSITAIVIGSRHPKLADIIPSLYSYAVSGTLFFDMSTMYENIFDRVPLSVVGQTWFIENMSSAAPKFFYDIFKRLLDIVVAGVLFVISLIVYPFVFIAIKLDGGGVIFSYQTRVGQYNRRINIAKFRTMTVANDDAKWGSNSNEKTATGQVAQKNEVTRVGRWLRMSRIDELPQLWNVLRGDISLIGPRPEFPEPVDNYAQQIPYYNMRHIVKPGLSGWAQIYHEQHPHHGIDVGETANKLSYDLYYIKHRSFLLDLKIALRTIKVLITFVGR